MLKVINIIGICVALTVIISPLSVKARAYPATHNKEVYYRNAGERILDRVADRVLNKVFGERQDRQEKPFIPDIYGELYKDPTDDIIRHDKVLLLQEDNINGYRKDVYTGNTDILREVSKALSSYGVICVSYADAVRKAREAAVMNNISPEGFGVFLETYLSANYPVGISVAIGEYNKGTVSLSVSAIDSAARKKLFAYGGRALSHDMGEPEKDIAVRAIIRDFGSRIGGM